MTIEDALKEIRSKPKWYLIVDDEGNPLPQVNLIMIAKRIEQGSAKNETIVDFFAKFGYEVKINKVVTKKQ